MNLIFITHPEVVVGPLTEVTRWHLSDKGIERMRRFARSILVRDVSVVWASTETKAIEAAEPDASIKGWERAGDAQARVKRAVEGIMEGHEGTGDLAIIAHGAVGTLLLCRYLGSPIRRDADQLFQRHYWMAEWPRRRISHGWRPIAPRS